MFANTGPRMKRTCRLPSRVVLDHLGAEDVARHQVRRELDAVELQAHCVRERLDEQRLGEPRHAAQQAVSAGKQAGDDLAANLLLADDDAPDLRVEARDEIGGLVERNQGGRRGNGLCGHWKKATGRSGPSSTRTSRFA